MKENRTLVLVLMLFITGILNADQSVMNAMLGPIKDAFRVTDADIGLVSGLFTVLGAVVSLFAGYLTDKSNRKWLFVAAVLIGEVPCFLTAFATDYNTFFLLRILTGFGVGASFPVVYSIIGDMFEDKKRASMAGIMTASIGIGQVIGIPLGGLYDATPLKWGFPFILASVPSIPFVIAYIIFARDTKRGASEESIKALVADGYIYPKKIQMSDYLKLIKVKTNVVLFIQGLLGTIPWGAIPLFLVDFLNKQRGFTIGQGIVVFLGFGVGNIIGTIMGGIIGERLYKKDHRLVPIFCSVTTVLGSLAGLSVFLFIPSGNLPFMMAGGFVAAFLVSMTGPNVRTMLLDTNVPENRGAIFSIFNLTDSVGTGIGKSFAGFLSMNIGITMALSVSALFWLPCAVILWFAANAFSADVKKLGAKMKKVAMEMRAGAR